MEPGINLKSQISNLQPLSQPPMEVSPAQRRLPEIITLAAILLLALLFRTYGLNKVPPAFLGDEANIALDAQSILQGNFYLITPHEGGEGSLWAYLLALAFALFKPSIASARGLAVAVSVAGVGAVFMLARCLLLPLLGRWQALAVAAISGLYLSVALWHVNLSRLAFPQTLGALVQVSFFILLWLTLRKNRLSYAIFAGILLGLTAYSYVPFKLTPLLVLVFILLEALANRRRAFLWTRFKWLLTIAAVGGAFYLPLLISYANGGLRKGTGAFTLFNPLVNRGNFWGALFNSIAGNLAGFLPFIPQVGGVSIARGLDTLSLIFFLFGLLIALYRRRCPEFLFLALWWAVMLVPSIIAPEGPMPHLRRAIGTAAPAFILTGVGLVTPLTWLSRLYPRRRPVFVALGALLVAFSLFTMARQTWVNYYLPQSTDEAYALINHIYDFELADVMAAEGDAGTAYILPVDASAGAIFPESSTLAFLYQNRGQADYAYIWDNEEALFPDTARLLQGKNCVGLVHWKVSKHSKADPRHLFEYVLERAGTFDRLSTHKYFDITYYRLDPAAAPVSPADLSPPGGQRSAVSGQSALSFDGQFALTGAAFAAESPADEPLWVELRWKKLAESPDLQVGLLLVDKKGHIVGKNDHPLLSDRLHRPASNWETGAEERDYVLITAEPGTPPGKYHLKVILYRLDEAGQSHRLAPVASNVGADLALPLGATRLLPPKEILPFEAYHIPPTRYELVLGSDNLHLLSVSGLPNALRPGDRGTVTLWWRSMGDVTSNGSAALQLVAPDGGIIFLSPAQALGGADYPTQKWPVGMTARQFLDYALPADAPAGNYQLQLALPAFKTGSVNLGSVSVAGRPRFFIAPPMTHRADVNFGNQITLLGYDVNLSPEKAAITLVWQAQQEMDTPYKVFLHLLDAKGQIAAQLDREPQQGQSPTTSWLPGEVVVDEMEIPLPAALVDKLLVGLYNSADGKRLSLGATGETSYELQVK